MYSPNGLVSVGVRQDTRESNYSRILPAKALVLQVEPRGFEPLTSAVQRRQDSLLVVSIACKMPANYRVSASTLFLAF